MSNSKDFALQFDDSDIKIDQENECLKDITLKLDDSTSDIKIKENECLEDITLKLDDSTSDLEINKNDCLEDFTLKLDDSTSDIEINKNDGLNDTNMTLLSPVFGNKKHRKRKKISNEFNLDSYQTIDNSKIENVSQKCIDSSSTSSSNESIKLNLNFKKRKQHIYPSSSSENSNSSMDAINHSAIEEYSLNSDEENESSLEGSTTSNDETTSKYSLNLKSKFRTNFKKLKKLNRKQLEKRLIEAHVQLKKLKDFLGNYEIYSTKIFQTIKSLPNRKLSFKLYWDLKEQVQKIQTFKKSFNIDEIMCNGYATRSRMLKKKKNSVEKAFKKFRKVLLSSKLANNFELKNYKRIIASSISDEEHG